MTNPPVDEFDTTAQTDDWKVRMKAKGLSDVYVMTFTCGVSYGESEPRRPRNGRSPAWYAWHSQATILPSDVKPLFMRMTAAGRTVA